MSQEHDNFREDLVESIQTARANDLPNTEILSTMLCLALELAREDSEEDVAAWDGITTQLQLMMHAAIERIFDGMAETEESNPETDVSLS